MSRAELLRRAVAAVLVAGLFSALGLVVASFAGGSGTPTVTVRAVFSDVAGLDSGAPVQVADITVGRVDSITLDGTSALVTLTIDRSARVPADVSAQISQATILGEEVVQLVPTAGVPAGPLLADGATIRHTSLVPGVEQLVQAGTAVIGSIGTSDLASLVEAGAQGFGGQGPTLRRLLADLDDVSSAYASRDGEITTLVGDLDRLGAALAPSAGSNAEAIVNFARASTVLASESGQLDDLLGELDRVSVAGRSILETYLPQIDLQLLGLDRVTDALAARQGDLALLLEELPGHDATTHDLTVGDFAQVVNDLIVCGLPGGGESSQASQTCSPGGGTAK
jgi:phospholipid/cholesterol/gamma-HCH transport system substrate-binding protein